MSFFPTFTVHMRHFQGTSKAFPRKSEKHRETLTARVNMPQQYRLQAFNIAWSIYVCATTMAGDAVNHATSTAGSAASQVIISTGNATNSAGVYAGQHPGWLQSALASLFDIFLYYSWFCFPNVCGSFALLLSWRECCTVQLKQKLVLCGQATASAGETKNDPHEAQRYVLAIA